MNLIFKISFAIIVLIFCVSCNSKQAIKKKELTAEHILGNPDYLAISYGG